MGVKTGVLPYCNLPTHGRSRKRSISHVISLSLSSLRSSEDEATTRDRVKASSPRLPAFAEVVVISSSDDEKPGFLRSHREIERGLDATVTLTPEKSHAEQICYVDISPPSSSPGSGRDSLDIQPKLKPTSSRQFQLRKRRQIRASSRYRCSKRRSGEPIITYTISPAVGEERFRSVPTLNHGVEIRESTIPSAGRGLFASRTFKRGELVTEYVGEIITRDEAKRRLRRGQFHYLGTLVTGMYEIDGIQEPQDNVGAASFINHARKPHANVQWAHIEDRRACFRRLFAKACRDIAAGEELFLDYGKTYWEHHRRWKLALEKGRDALSDETLSDEDERSIDYSDNAREIHIIDSDDVVDDLPDGKYTSTASSFRVDMSTTGGEDDGSTSSDRILSQFANEFHLRPCEPPPRTLTINNTPQKCG